MAQQYDVSLSQKQILEEKAKRREFLRKEFQKQASDPFRHASGEGGGVFDPAYQRYQAIRVNAYKFFKPSPNNAMQLFFLTILPIGGFAYLLWRDKTTKEARYRSGEVAYKDRRWKLI